MAYNIIYDSSNISILHDINFGRNLNKNINNNNYTVETVRSELYFRDKSTDTTSNLIAEPYLESGERAYPASRLFTSNNFTLANQHIVSNACGANHTIFLTNDGKVFSCGLNSSGQLGLGNTINQPTPQPISTLNSLTISAIAGGANHTIFLTNNGKVYSCGSNGSGQLGQSTSTTTPSQITNGIGPLTISAIACGANYTLFLTNDGKVYSCGSNGSGQLGQSTSTTTPTQITNGIESLTISAIAAGGNHTLFLTNDGKVYSCGLNSSSQLGQSTSTTVPSQITNGIGELTISAIDCGDNHTLFITNDGKVYSCGRNSEGQLGQSTSTSTPSQITNGIGTLTISAISAGGNHTMFLTNDGKVYSCGYSGYGILGRTGTTSVPEIITNGIGALTISFIDCGSSHTLFLTNDNKVFSFGRNNIGQLGITTNSGTDTANQTPSIIDTFSLSTIYGTGLYTISYSSFTSSFEPFKCFNEESTSNNQGTWRSGDYLSTGLFDSTTYSTSNLVSGYNGDWLVIKLPLSIKLKRFVIKQISSDLISAPRNFRLYGSTNGTSWTLLIDKQNASYANLLYTHADMSQYASDANNYYNHFGLVVSALVGTSTTLSFDEFFIYGSQSLTYTPITNNDTKTLTLTSSSVSYLNSYNITFPVPTMTDFNNNSNIILQGDYDINLTSTGSQIIPKTGKYIPFEATSNFSPNLSLRYHLLNPIKINEGAQWTYNSSNTNVYYLGNVGIGTTEPKYTVDITGDIRITGSINDITSNELHNLKNINYNIKQRIDSNDSNQSNYILATSNILSTQILNLNADNITSGAQNKFIINNIYNGNLTINSNLTVLGTSTTLNTDVYTTERLEISNTNPTSTAFEVNQIDTATKILSAFTTGTSKNEIFTISTNGKVGINKTTPEYNLDITGDVRITGDLYKGAEKIKGSNWTSNTDGILSYYNVAIGKELVASSPHKLDVGGNIKFSGDLYKNINNNNYVVETVRSELYFKDKSITTTSNLIAEPYLESGERMYPPSRLFTTNNLTFTDIFVSIIGGGNHNIFLTNNGKVYSCGNNYYGQLGLGNSGTGTDQNTPQLISTNIGTLTISAVACGLATTLFLTNEGKVYSCGENYYGQLGLGYSGTGTNQNTPQLISALNSLTISAIASGGYHTLFLTNDGKVYGCGSNGAGNLGLGDRTDRNVPTLISALNSFTISTIDCGENFSAFITNNGKVYVCGANNYGQMCVNSDITHIVDPTIVSALNSFTISAIACGGGHILFLTNDGKVYSCGKNYDGELGLGLYDTTGRYSPTLITETISSLTISAIKCGTSHTLFLTNDGKVYGCGSNGQGQLALYTPQQKIPKKLSNTTGIDIIGTLTISAIECGGHHTILLTNDKKIYVCGHNGYGQLALGTTPVSSYPTIVPYTSSIYGSGLYTISYSSFTSSFEPFRCFNEGSTANNQGKWRSGDYLSTGLFDSTTYNTSNLVSGYNGDWLVIKLPLSIKLKRFVIKQISSDLISAPRNFRLYGSTNGTSWTLLIDKQNASYTNLLYTHTDMSQYASDSNKYYNHFGLVVSALVGTSTTLSFDELFIYGAQSLTYTPITNSNTKTLTLTSSSDPSLNSYNITFPVPTMTDFNNNSNIILQGDYDINLTSTGSKIIPKTGKNIPFEATSNFSPTLSLRYHLLNPIIIGAQWTYNSSNTDVYYLGNVGIGTTEPEYNLDITGDVRITGDLYKNINNNNYAVETVRSELYIKDNSIAITSNLIAEPYLESGERMYPPSRLFTTNNLTFTGIFVSMVCGGNYTVFITNDGKVYSCGDNSKGQLGLGDTTNRSVPTLISALNSFTISKVARIIEGKYVMFITNNGKVYACGNNEFGQLGLGNSGTGTDQNTPQLITALNSLTISAIACGTYHTIFATNEGKVYSCGYNTHGELGLNNTTHQSTPQPITALNSVNIKEVACGEFHTVFLTNDGKVYSCGRNPNGELGLGDRTDKTTPQLISALSSLTISAIGCGGDYTLFLTNDGKVYKCGTDGQQGAFLYPVIISANIGTLTISAIACGTSHTVLLTNDGKVYSFGYNSYGQMGLGNTTPANQNTPTPQLITALNSLTISAIACGSAHTVFLTNDRKVYSCGYNGYGQLALGTFISPYTTPTIAPSSTSSIYGSGLYTISYSSFTSSFEPFKCFNEDSAANNQGTWRSGDYLSTGLFDSTTYSTSNLVSGYNGDWLVIKLPLSIKLKRFVIKQISSALTSAPRNFRLYGSTNGTSWTLLIDKQNASYTSLLYTHTDMSQYASDANKYYNHFGLVVSALVGTATTLSFDEFFIYGSQSLTYTPITNSNTKTLTFTSSSEPSLNSYNITFQVPTMTDFNNNSNIILYGDYDINLTSTGSQIIPKTGKNIPLEATSNFSPTLSLRYHLLNPIAIGAQWTYNSSNADVYYLGNVGIGRTDPEYNLDITGDVRITGDLYKGAEKIKGSNWTSNINGILSYSNVAIGKELVASSPHKLDVGGNINFSGDLYKNNLIFKASNWTSNIDGILSYSNVAIGKELVASSPHKLDVGGNINFSGDLYKNNLIFKASNWTSNINGILSYSNVAIGKELVASSPHKLDVGGNINFSGDLYKNNLIFKASNWTSNIDGILSYSNVAIGKELVASSPHKLDVGGSINISSGSKYKINGANLSFSDLEGSLPTGSSQWITSNNNIYYNVGNVGINIINPIEKLDVNGNIRSSGSITSFSSFSDERLKDREGNIENPIDIVDKLQGFYYRPNKTANNLGIQGNKRELGISAQDVEKILPELVNIAPADMAYDEEKNIISKTGSNYLTVNYEKMIPLLIESIKELNKNINDLKKENIELRNLIKSQ